MYNNVGLEYDQNKRDKTLQERGLDFAQAGEIFTGVHYTLEDNRFDYGEQRFISIGYMRGRLVVVVWTPRGYKKRIISLRKANEREAKRFKKYLG